MEELIFTEQISEVLLGALFEIMKIVVSFIIGWIGFKAKDYLNDKGKALKLSEKEKYAKIAVQAVEMTLNEFDSKAKFEKAKDKLIKLANDNNIPVKESELDSLIDSAVIDLKAEGKEIKKIYNEQIGFKK